MDINIMPSLYTLPVELLHRIFDNLDTETILLSMRYVCKRFSSITNNYNRYKLNFKSIFKHKYHRICQAAHPQNVISLVLSDENQTPGQIRLFLSLHHIEDFTRLQSMTLLSIQERHLKLILEHISTTCSLTSMLITYEQNSTLSIQTLQLLSHAIGKTSLRKLDLKLGYGSMNKLEWPIECSVQYLKISNSIWFKQFSTILCCSPHLKTMILRDCMIYDIEEITYITLSRQLTSLKLEDCDLEMSIIESLLLLTPSLVQFTLVGNSSDLFDGTRWEQFIQTKLPNLNNFRFAFQSNINISHDHTGLESLIASFRTPFWLETKQWFVTALSLKNSQFINLYTIPDCVSKISYHPNTNKILSSTIPMTIKDLITMDNTREMTLDLIEIQVDMITKRQTSSHRLFNKLTKLTLRVNEDWPIGSLEFLSTFIDLSTITELVLDADFTPSDDFNTIAGIIALLESTFNVRSLTITNHSTTLQTICSIVPRDLQHLEIPVNSVEDMKTISKRFEQLSSVTFKFLIDSLVSIEEMIEWLSVIGKDFTFQSNQRLLILWLGRRMNISF